MPLPDRDMRIAGIQAAMDQARTERLRAEMKIKRLTLELVRIGDEARAELQELTTERA